MEGLRNTHNPELLDALRHLAREWGNSRQRWLVGGSCGLWLQSIALEQAPRDIDVYTDLTGARDLHEILGIRSIDEQVFDESGIYVSLLSHYQMGQYVLELVGGFEIKTEGSHYKVEIEELLSGQAPIVQLETEQLRLMPLSHEFLFNVLRDRPDRYVPIARAICLHTEDHLPLLRDLITRNKWSQKHLDIIASQLSGGGILDGL
ncbi:hypothetical protein EJP77_03650 [Paenibacillus zeisoli]|uniref:Nucleotidyltransferase family protein n=1 Tax=Paenibacillus zeisoli TaxID=2496267 RepID=A0A433XPU2_9BACL|nr:hypothetical protein [Paenibacillus zeisoli]RUT36095.1 hypothetical protein EJP77_03650 [Paenibacillus zeisoli]